MFRTKSCVILGAGANFDFGMPLGTALLDDIRSRALKDMNNRYMGQLDHGGLLALPLWAGLNSREFAPAVKLLHDAADIFNSIDDFLDVHRENRNVVTLGKLAIAKCILDKEGASLLRSDPESAPGPTLARVRNKWYWSFFGHLIAGASPETIFDNLSIISFNYDRCTEYFLFHMVKTAFALSDDDASSALKRLKIYHPYGTVGRLPELNAGKGTPFGANERNLAAISEGIHTYTEQVTDQDQQRLLHDEMRGANRFLFFGFAFHAQNMELLRPGKDVFRSRPVYASAKGILNEDRPGVVRRIQEIFTSEQGDLLREGFCNIGIGKDCGEFLDAYKITLFS